MRIAKCNFFVKWKREGQSKRARRRESGEEGGEPERACRYVEFWREEVDISVIPLMSEPHWSEARFCTMHLTVTISLSLALVLTSDAFPTGSRKR